MLSEREYATRDGFNAVQEEMQAWLEEIEAERVDVHYDGVGLLERIRFWLTENGVKRPLNEPDEDSYDAIVVLRKVQAVPGRGAWFWSHLWMEMPEGVLHQESDWMGEPELDMDEEPDLYHYKAELNHYPRDEKNIPDWLRKKVAQWEVERGPAFKRRIAELEEDFYVLTHGPRGSQAEREAAPDEGRGGVRPGPGAGGGLAGGQRRRARRRPHRGAGLLPAHQVLVDRGWEEGACPGRRGSGEGRRTTPPRPGPAPPRGLAQFTPVDGRRQGRAAPGIGLDGRTRPRRRGARRRPVHGGAGDAPPRTRTHPPLAENPIWN